MALRTLFAASNRITGDRIRLSPIAAETSPVSDHYSAKYIFVTLFGTEANRPTNTIIIRHSSTN